MRERERETIRQSQKERDRPAHDVTSCLLVNSIPYGNLYSPKPIMMVFLLPTVFMRRVNPTVCAMTESSPTTPMNSAVSCSENPITKRRYTKNEEYWPA